jgi:hypothetical protein
MRMVRARRLLPILGLLLGIAAIPALANTTYMTAAADPTGRYLNPLTFIQNRSIASSYAGAVQATLGGGSTFAAFSLNPFVGLTFGTQYIDNAVLPSDATAQALSTNIGRAAWLYVTEISVVNAASNKAVAGAALQLAIWDVMVDGGDGLSAGQIRSASGQNSTTQAVYTQAAAWITASSGKTSNTATVLINGGGASPLITASGALNAGSTPEPSSVLMLGSGLLLLGIAVRKRSA